MIGTSRRNEFVFGRRLRPSQETKNEGETIDETMTDDC